MEDHDGHRQRLRMRLEKEGIDHFAPHEVLELLLFFSIPRADTNPIAHRLLRQFGSLSGVLEAPRSELLKVSGVGEKSADLLSLIPQLSRRYLMDKNDVGVVLDTTEKIGKYLLPLFVGHNNERLYLLCLDQKRKLLGCELLAEGTPGQVMVEMRLIVEIALRTNASAVVLAHNHTQGFAMPSEEDLAMTERVRSTLKSISVTLIDHIIVSGEEFVSISNSGRLLYRRLW